MSSHEITTQSEADTERLGRSIAALLAPGMVVALQGDLGTGKTVLTRGVARGLGIAEPVTSPTFTVVQEYRRPDRTWLFHLDMYRINNEEEALAFGVEEYLFAPDGVTVIEWPERIAGLLEDEGTPSSACGVRKHAGESPLPRLLALRLEHVADSARRITLPRALNDLLRPLSPSLRS